MGWSDHAISRLRELWAEGQSAGEIGVKLRKTKNAVIGKIFRLGLGDDNRAGDSKIAARRARKRRKRDCQRARGTDNPDKARQQHRKLLT